MKGGIIFLLTLIAVHSCLPEASLNTKFDTEYLGDYRVGPNHVIGIDHFVREDNKDHLFFTDYASGVIRLLSPSSEGEFVAGPGFEVDHPVELTIRFLQGFGGDITGLAVKRSGDAEIFAERIPLRQEDVTFRSGSETLAGTVLTPASEGAHPAIILLHGSGPLTRFSFGPYPHFFASLGFTVLTYDKRGAGASTGDLEHATFDDLADDALAALNVMRKRSNIREIGFWGSSEGGMLTTQVAARSNDVAFAINSSGFMMPLWEQDIYEIGALLREDGFSKRDIATAISYDKQKMQVARTGKGWEDFRRAQSSFRDTKWFSHSGQEVVSSLDELRWSWIHLLSFSPLPALPRVKCPVLGVFGELDNSTPAIVAVANMRRVLGKAGHKDFTLKIFPKANHPLMEARTGGHYEIPTLTRMAPGVFETLTAWLSERVPVQKMN